MSNISASENKTNYEACIKTNTMLNNRLCSIKYEADIRNHFGSRKYLQIQFDSFYSNSNIGPKIEPWGTPVNTVLDVDTNSPSLTTCVRFERYDLKNFIVFSEKLYVFIFFKSMS